jgi:hypothetical protein
VNVNSASEFHSNYSLKKMNSAEEEKQPTLHKKQLQRALSCPTLQIQISMGPMNSKQCFFHYQTCCACVLSKTQTQPPIQTES